MADQLTPRGSALLSGTRRRLVKAGAAVAWTVPVMHTLTAQQAAAVTPPTKGCSPGFYKNNTPPCSATPKTQLFTDALDLTGTEFTCYTSKGLSSSMTVAQALELTGGGANALARHAAAAFLNAICIGTAGGYPYTVSQVQTIVGNAFTTCTTAAFDAASELLKAAEEPCPLSATP
jgi:hypothetical protein